MSVLAGTTWVFNSTITLPSNSITYYKKNTLFLCKDIPFNYINFEPGPLFPWMLYGEDESGSYSTVAYDPVGGWGRLSLTVGGTTISGRELATITFVEDPGDVANFRSWLQSNAIQLTSEYITNDVELTLIANAIKSKRGITSSLSYPNGFVTAIQDIDISYWKRYFIESKASLQTINDNNISIIDKGAFAFCNIKSVALPNCTRINDYAFAGCTSLSSVFFQSCSHIGASAFYRCSSFKSASFPLCTQIGSGAFEYCGSLSIAYFPECSTIGSNAFHGCYNLSSVSFPKCTSIGAGAFSSAGTYSAVVSFPLCTFIDDGAFYRVYFSEIYLPNCISMSGCSVFYSCNVKYVDLSSCTNIVSSAFQSCHGLSSVKAPKVTSIGSAAFDNSGLLIADFPSCTYVDQAFRWCQSLTTVNLPLCPELHGMTFQFCTSLSSVSLPICSILSWGEFRECSNLKTISLPACTVIYSYAFDGCSTLESVYLTGTSYCSLLDTGAFYGTPLSKSSYIGKFGSIYVRSSMLATYKAMSNWSYFSSRFVGI